jgi:hypothetical protein
VSRQTTYEFRIMKGKQPLPETVVVEAESVASALLEAKSYLLPGESIGLMRVITSEPPPYKRRTSWK